MRKLLLFTVLFVGAVCSHLNGQIRVACLVGDTIDLNISQARGAIQWQASTDSLVWTDIPGATAEQFNYIPSQGIQWVRAAISESDCPPFYEHPIYVSAIDTAAADFDPLIIVMDTVTVQFLPDSAQQSIGQYDFQVTGSNVNIDPGDILIGTDGMGFLVAVDNFIRSNNQLVIQTHQASLDDLFDDVEFDLEILLDSLEQRDFGVQLDINNLVIANNGAFNFDFPAFHYQMTGASQWASLYSASDGVQQFTMNCNYQLGLGGELRLIPNSQGTSSDAQGVYQLAIYDNTTEIQVNGNPVLYTTKVDLLIEYNLVQSGTSCEINSSFGSDVSVGYDLLYTPAGSHDLFNFDAAPLPDYSLFSNDDHCNSEPGYAHYEITFKTLVSSYFYNQQLLEVEISKFLDSKYDEFGGKWDKSITVEPILFDEVSLGVLGVNDPFDYSIQSPLENIYELKAPFELSLVSGSGQSATADSMLLEPIVLHVMDSHGEPVKDARVWINISGGGTLDTESLFTNADGDLSFHWTLGNSTFDFQLLTIRVQHADGSDIQGSPLEVNANITSSCDGLTTIADSDGNIYPVIAIGNQCWTKTNLRTTHYSNSDEIPNLVDLESWDESTQTPAWAYYNNNPTYNDVYGKLYNWYAVTDSRNVCPVGWHVPNLTDWIELVNLLDTNATGNIFNESGGIYSLAGGSMKATGIIEDGTGLWESPNGGATNLSGFSALPGGFITTASNPMGGTAAFWSSSIYDETRAHAMLLYAFTGHVLDSPNGFGNGFSIRCLKDN